MWYEDHEIRTFCTHKNDGDFRDRIDARLLFPCAYRIPFYIYLLNEIELSVLPSIFCFNKYFTPHYFTSLSSSRSWKTCQLHIFNGEKKFQFHWKRNKNICKIDRIIFEVWRVIVENRFYDYFIVIVLERTIWRNISWDFCRGNFHVRLPINRESRALRLV